MAGLHQVVWTASGANAGTHTGSFGISAAEPALLPISLTEARRIPGVGVDAARDELIRDDLRAALGHIERHTGQTYRRRVVTEPTRGSRVGCPPALILRQSPAGRHCHRTPAPRWRPPATAWMRWRASWLGWVAGCPVVITYTVGASSSRMTCSTAAEIPDRVGGRAQAPPAPAAHQRGRPERTIAGALAALNVVMPGWA